MRKICSPLSLLICLALAQVVYLGWLWLPLPASNEELLGYVGKMAYFRDTVIGLSGLSWWVPGYLGGSSAAGMISYIGAMPGYLLAGQVFGDETGFKIFGLICIFLSALAAFALGRKVFENDWAGFALGVLYVSCPAILIRLGWVEHLTILPAFPAAPLVFLGVLLMSERFSAWHIALFSAAFSFCIVSSTKVGATLVPAIVLFGAALFLHFPERRGRLLASCAGCLVLVILLGCLPLLPLLRETRFMGVFETDPFAGWQSAFSVRSLASWLDRGGDLFAGLPGGFTTDRGGYYLGAITFLAISAGAALWIRRPHEPSDRLFFFRTFLGIALFLFWLCFGPRSVFSGLREFLGSAVAARDVAVLAHWMCFIASGVLIYWLRPRGRVAQWFWVPILFGFWFVPGFRIIEMIPLYSDIRAPDSFWIVAGSLSASVAGTGGLVLCFESLNRRLAGRQKWLRVLPWALGGILMIGQFVDASAYYTHFSKGNLSRELYADFEEAMGFLSQSNKPGSVIALSGRYFYLRIPEMSGRALISEAAHKNFMLRGMTYLQTASHMEPALRDRFYDLAGVTYILLDLADPQLPREAAKELTERFPTAFENGFFRILENPGSLAPAYVARQVMSVPGESHKLALRQLQLAMLGLVSVEEAGRLTPGLTIGAISDEDGGARFDELLAAVLPLERLERLERSAPDRILAGAPPAAGWLVVTQAYHPDWRAWQGGVPLRVRPALAGLLAAAVDARDADVVFEFRQPVWYIWALFGSLGAWVVVFAAALVFPLLPRNHPLRGWWFGTPVIRSVRQLSPPKVPQKLLVVIPTFQEAEDIEKVLEQVLRLPCAPDVLVVDDSPEEATADTVKGFLPGGRVRLVRRGAKLGLASAYKQGFETALREGYEIVAQMDGDLSHDPGDLQRLVDSVASGRDVAIGSRYLGGVRVIDWPIQRLMLSLGATTYVRFWTRLPLTDATSGFKVIRTSALAALDWTRFRAEGYGFQVELHVALWRGGWSIVEVPIVFTERAHGHSKMSSWIAVEAALRVPLLSFTRSFEKK